MSEYEDFLEELQVVYGYKQIINKIRTNLKSAYKKRIREYAIQRSKLGLICTPNFISDTQAETDDFQIGNTNFLKQALFFGETAKTASKETKPLLYHYAENSMFVFFVYSLFSYSKPALDHGLKIIWGQSWTDTKVQIKKFGFFTRIIDCYAMLGVDTHFSALRHENLQGTFVIPQPTATRYPFFKQPILTLNNIIEIRKKLGNQDSGHYYDVIDFVLLFFASSLARYRPYFWQQIIEGKQGIEITSFQKCFKRFDLVLERLVRVLTRIAWKLNDIEPPYPLNAIDYEVKQRRWM